MQDVAVPLWLLACTFGAWLGFRLSLAMHEGAADSRAPTVARLLVTGFCLSITTLFLFCGATDRFVVVSTSTHYGDGACHRGHAATANLDGEA
jgi:hypothetical protein